LFVEKVHVKIQSARDGLRQASGWSREHVLGVGGRDGARANDRCDGHGLHTLEESLSTAERRTTNIQSTPAAVSVRSGEELAQQAAIRRSRFCRTFPASQP